jgi:hypothetical protein
MDDGSLQWVNKSTGLKLCTDYFKLGEVIHLKSFLENSYNLRVSLPSYVGKNEVIRYRISLSAESSYTFVSLIKPYIISSMYYKLSF